MVWNLIGPFMNLFWARSVVLCGLFVAWFIFDSVMFRVVVIIPLVVSVPILMKVVIGVAPVLMIVVLLGTLLLCCLVLRCGVRCLNYCTVT